MAGTWEYGVPYGDAILNPVHSDCKVLTPEMTVTADKDRG